MSLLQRIKPLPVESKIILVSILLSILVGCVNILMPPNAPIYANTHPTYKQCQPFVLPVFKPLPEVPNIPTSILNDKDKTDTILVNKIKELRSYAKSMREELETANKRHLESCL